MSINYKLRLLVLLSSIIAGICFFYGGSYLFLSSLFIFFVLYVEHSEKSKKESVFYNFTFLYTEVFIFMGIAFSGYSNTVFTYLALFGILLVNHMMIQYQATLVDTKCKNKIGIKDGDYGGILDRNNRLFALMILPLVQYVSRSYLIGGLSFTDWFMFLFAFLIIITIIQRFIKIYLKLKC
jgi:hypothetical protein